MLKYFKINFKYDTSSKTFNAYTLKLICYLLYPLTINFQQNINILLSKCMSLPVYINLNCSAAHQKRNHLTTPPVANFLDIYLRICFYRKKNITSSQHSIQSVYHTSFMYLHKNRTKNINKNQRPFKSDRRIGGP